MAFADYEYRHGVGYFSKADQSGPYWLDDAGAATLMVSRPKLPGISQNPAYEYRDNAGWFHKTTGAGPYIAS